MLPEGLILDQGLVLFGFSLFTATIPSQIHLSVLMVVFISTLKTIIIPFLTTRMLEQSAQVRPVWSGRGSPAGKASVSFPEKLWINEITAFRTYLREDSGHTVILEH